MKTKQEIKKIKLNYLEKHTYREYNQRCELCKRKVNVVYQPNRYVVKGDTKSWEICRSCLKERFEL